jgi:cytochrome b561
MRLLNHDAGYGAVSKGLHWLTVALLAAQIMLGYRLEEFAETFVDDDSDYDESLVFLHAGLGIAVLALATIRLLWRLATPLPRWSERLSALDRRIEHRVEQVLYLMLFVMPATGLGLLYFSGEERDIAEDHEWQPPFDIVDADVALAAHVASHVVLYAAVAVHVGLVLWRRTFRRMV